MPARKFGVIYRQCGGRRRQRFRKMAGAALAIGPASDHPRQTFVGDMPTPARGFRDGTPGKLRPNAMVVGEFQLLVGQMSAGYSWTMPTIDLPDDELAALTAAIRDVIEGDRFPHAPRLDRCGRRWRGSMRRL